MISTILYLYKKMIQQKRLLLVSVLGITIIAVAFLAVNIMPCKRISCLSLKDNSKFKLVDTYEESRYIFRGLYKKNNILLRLEERVKSTKSEAKQAIITQITRAQGLFDEIAAPYPGEISDVVSCSPGYEPIYSVTNKDGVEIFQFSGFVNERLVFGSCTADQAIYYDTMAMFYCERQKNFFQVELIIPKDEYLKDSSEYKEVLNSLGCKQ